MKLRLVLVYTTAMFVAPLAAQAMSPLTPAADASLRQSIAQARKTDATPFANVSDIVTKAAERHAAARGRHAPVAQSLARLGAPAVLPILELLAVDKSNVARRDLIEATGLLADARALPVLNAIVGDAGEDAETTRTSAEAIARIGTMEAATTLVSTLNAAHGDRERALVAGMGECRRGSVTDALATRARSSDAALSATAARSLGRAGNAWAWKTLSDHTEEPHIRETAARALVDAFVAHDGEARLAASNALMVVDSPLTPSLIAQARPSAPPATQTALDSLATRFASNPTR